MGIKALFFCAFAVSIAYVLYPYQHSIKYILTQEIDLTECPVSNSAPTLQLTELKNCKDVDQSQEPCVIRHALSQAKIDKFVEDNGHHYFLTRDEPGNAMGNPLSEARFLRMGEDFKKLESHLCNFNDLINQKPECQNTYTGFKSLNFSNYEALHVPEDGILDLSTFSRTDIFLGNPSDHKVTASFHSNNFEESSTLQLVGEKIWLLMPRESFYGRFRAVAIGAYNAIANTCIDDLAKTPLQAVRTGPGDVLRFPKAYPHHIYSLAGPNIMINFRNFVFNVLNPRDVLAMIGQVLVKQAIAFENCPGLSAEHDQVIAPTSFAQGNSQASWFVKYMFGDTDMRCVSAVNKMIVAYKTKFSESSLSRKWDQEIFAQAAAFVGFDQ